LDLYLNSVHASVATGHKHIEQSVFRKQRLAVIGPLRSRPAQTWQLRSGVTERAEQFAASGFRSHRFQASPTSCHRELRQSQAVPQGRGSSRNSASAHAGLQPIGAIVINPPAQRIEGPEFQAEPLESAPQSRSSRGRPHFTAETAWGEASSLAMR